MSNHSTVLVIDESQHEATLAASAIALRHPGLEVKAVQNIGAALRYLQDAAAPRLVILGRKALDEAATLVNAIHAVPIVGLAGELSVATRQRAMAAGVQAIYQRPAGWTEYRDVVTGILKDWLRTGA
jgi:DNA-binding NtrC family response regulator